MASSETLVFTPRPTNDRPDVPGWEQVEETLAGLARERATFATTTSATNRITGYDPGRRLLLETDSGPAWLDVGDIRECWQTFERLGRICRRDVLEPGRRAAFMMALFALVPGVAAEDTAEPCLVLARA